MLNRRILFQLLGATALCACGPKQARATGLRVVVVGAGIVGASIAYHLVKLGATVTAIDALGPSALASRGTFAWINATWAKQPRSYHALNQAGLSSWASLQEELEIPVKWGGSLEWFGNQERQARLAEQIAEQVEWGEPAAMIGGDDLAALEPHVDFSGVESAAFSGNDGAVDPVLATQALLDGAQRLGATVKYPCALTGVSISGGSVRGVETSLGFIEADRVILATGAAPDAARQFAEMDLPQRTTPGVIAITKPMPPLLNRLVIAPGVHMHQRLDGRVVLGEQDGAPDTPEHAARLEGRPVVFPSMELANAHFARLQAVASQFVPALWDAEPEEVHIGWRPLPLDGHPVLGFSPARPEVYLAITHSGVSLAPIIGQLAAQEIATGRQVDRLEDYRPDREFENVKRY